jgi:hypothetical protein
VEIRFSILLLLISLSGQLFSQDKDSTFLLNDTSFSEKRPLQIKVSVLFSRKNVGFTIGLGHYLKHKEIVRHKKSGKIKTLKKDKILSVDVSYYYQPGLNHNWFLTASYAIRRTGNRGYYVELSPMLGVSRTFLTNATYTVSDDGSVHVKKLAGNWYVTSGFAWGFGKTFRKKRNFFLNDIHVNLFTQFLYPNFGFIVFKPFWQIGTSFNLQKMKWATKKIIKQR